MGTLINVIGILGGGALGMLLQKGISARFQEIIMKSVGLAVLFLGILSTVEASLVIEGGKVGSQGAMNLILSLLVGAIIGEAIDLDTKAERFGAWLRDKSGSQGDTRFIDGFVAASLTVTVGAMAVVGPLKEGMTGDVSILISKAILDAIIVFVMASMMGKGTLFSVIPMGLFQGSVFLLSQWVKPIMTEAAISSLSIVGGALIFCVGVNLMFDQKIKVANLLPAVFVAIALSFVL